ncbi:hypothetical protein D8682_00625 (plasmid) [Buttiauxella sp. 3AFRM03]|uniref:hypothetical protein n=1 Tax=Buttiauxella sp. 3AFRM03 TaxID=2479367 RepID=UPI000EF7C0F2|nr:hypothetical protein [Buttiauxella sp. 3AFRM03]AYN25613.1 hypothetical protein D8682_00625 [Buttiauxella sp. 3AFRM03]
MTYYVNDTHRMVTLLICGTYADATIYAAWANEQLDANQIQVEAKCHALIKSGDELLGYFGFSIDTLVDTLFLMLPARSRIHSNMALIKTLIREPELSKRQCCIRERKSPTHYSRLSNILSLHAKWVSDLSGGRNPMRLLRAIRGDL